MPTEIVFETHSWSEDNDRGIATGWLPGRLSPRGRALAAELGQRRQDDGIAAVFASDLRRAAETADIAFSGTQIPVLHDWRLRECNYGHRNGMPAAELHEHRDRYLDEAYPGGESWRQAVHRVGRFLDDVSLLWAGQRILVIGHVATRWALDHWINGVRLEDLINADFAWREGWEYRIADPRDRQDRTESTQVSAG
ncbi:histidine phosphatase family protein [Micromonospora sp. NPDC003776]